MKSQCKTVSGEQVCVTVPVLHGRDLGIGECEITKSLVFTLKGLPDPKILFSTSKSLGVLKVGWLGPGWKA